MTNLDYIRTLSAEELAVNVFWADEREGSCEMCAKNIKGKPCGGKCVDGIVEWLNTEYKPELKPCPFCGGKAEAIKAKSGVLWVVRCEDCGSKTRYCNTEAETTEKWNRRAE